MPNLYIIAGANGAGKTTSAFTVLPEIVNCREFVNADLIAKALSPFDYDAASIEAGRMMINRINKLIDDGVDFAFETTLSARSFVKLIEKAKGNKYYITIIFLWVNNYKIAVDRVKSRVREGGHSIGYEIIKRRYIKGIFNFVNIYLNKSDYSLLIDNSGSVPKKIAEVQNADGNMVKIIYEEKKWNKILRYAKK